MEFFAKLNTESVSGDEGSEDNLRLQNMLDECKEICINYIDLFEDKQYWE